MGDLNGCSAGHKSDIILIVRMVASRMLEGNNGPRVTVPRARKGEKAIRHESRGSGATRYK
jgi:hypothetical protein